MSWLAWLHPLLMAVLLLLVVRVLRLGLGLRRSRLVRRAADPARHARLARVAVPLVVLGWALGLGSMALLREQPVLESVHFPLASAAAAGLACAGALGLALQRGRALGARGAHALLGATGLLLGLAAAVAGMAILP